MSTVANNLPFVAACAMPMQRTVKERVFRARMGMLFFLAAEAMFFAGLISAYVVLSAQVSTWPPLGQPRLPLAITGFNTVVLLWSGLVLCVAALNYAKERSAKPIINWIAMAASGGLLFLAIQGREWLNLVRFGLATSDSVYAGTFYVLIGVHALHVLGGAAALTLLLVKATRSADADAFEPFFAATRLYWYFVVGVWPVLYGLVYWH